PSTVRRSQQMGRRKQPKAAPRQGAVYLRGTGVFTVDNVGAVLNAARLEPRKPPHWVAEALNEATADYFAAFALARTGTPSEQAKWARELRLAVEQCLAMLAPDARGERPRCADHRVHSALFHWGEPSDIELVAGPASLFGYNPARDALDAIPGKLWDLERMAAMAEEQWRSALRA